MRRFWDGLKVVVKAVPTWGAAAVAVLTFLSTTVVPHLPGDWPVKVGAWVVAALAAVTAVVRVVARVTPVLYPEDVGLLPAEPEEHDAEVTFWGEN